MPSPMDLAQAFGTQQEYVKPALQVMFETDDGLWGEIEDKTDMAEGVSMRQSRIPLSMQQQGYFAQFSPDGGDLGVGDGGTYEALTPVPVFLEQAFSWTWIVKWATDTKKKSITDLVKDIMDTGMEMFKSNIDSMLAASDGSGQIDSVTASTASTISVNNANLFQDQGIYQLFNSTKTVNRGNITVSYVDATQNLLNIQGSIPGGITNGDVLVIAGASGAATSSLNGIPYLQLNSNSGTYIGLNRGSFPGRLSTPLIGSGSAGNLTQLIARRLINAIDTALGINYTDKHEVMMHGNLDQATAWEQVAIAVSQVQQLQVGTTSPDMLPKKMPETIAGRKFFKNIHGIPGRLDALCLDSWGKVSNKPIGWADVGGMTVFPAYGGSGGIAAQDLAYYVWGGQVYNANPRAGAYATGLTKPYALGS